MFDKQFRGTNQSASALRKQNETQQTRKKEKKGEKQLAWPFLPFYTFEITPHSMSTQLAATSRCSWYIRPLQAQEYTMGGKQKQQCLFTLKTVDIIITSSPSFSQKKRKKLGLWIIHKLWVCVTSSAFSLRKLWENSARDTIVPLSSLMCNSVLGLFEIHVLIMRDKSSHPK